MSTRKVITPFHCGRHRPTSMYKRHNALQYSNKSSLEDLFIHVETIRSYQIVNDIIIIAGIKHNLWLLLWMRDCTYIIQCVLPNKESGIDGIHTGNASKMVRLEFLALCHALTSLDMVPKSPILLLRHCLFKTCNSISAIFNQLPCFGVYINSYLSHNLFSSPDGNAS